MPEFDSPDILVAFKKSRWEHYLEADRDRMEAAEEKDDASVRELRESHRVHRAGVEAVVDHLESEGFDPTAAYRGDIADTTAYDLIVTVGGDGTVLDLSHKVSDAPLLAVNSHPETSVGYFCAGPADAFPTLLEDVLAGRLSFHDLLRFRLRIDGELRDPPILNDVLVGHANPAAVSQYELTVGPGDPEPQRSSGIWVATPAGSTAAVRSAGGTVLPLGCNCIEYVVREPYPLPGEPYRHTAGIQPLPRRLEVRSRMQQGRIFVDGPHITHDFAFDQTLAIDVDAPDLTVYGLDVGRREADR